MKQYCRYCINLYVGNSIYCQAKRKILTESTTKCINTCKEFEFCEMDTYDTSKEYKPHTKAHFPHKITTEQISMFEEVNNNDRRNVEKIRE